jgi:hypothetical protein
VPFKMLVALWDTDLAKDVNLDSTGTLTTIMQ